MIISFNLTQKQILERTKSETRRIWLEKTARRFKAGTVHQGWSSLPRTKGAGKIADIRAIRDAWQQKLGDVDTAAAAREGFPEWTGNQFIEFFIKNAGKGGLTITRETLVWVAEFEIIKIYDEK